MQRFNLDDLERFSYYSFFEIGADWEDFVSVLNLTWESASQLSEQQITQLQNISNTISILWTRDYTNSNPESVFGYEWNVDRIKYLAKYFSQWPFAYLKKRLVDHLFAFARLLTPNDHDTKPEDYTLAIQTLRNLLAVLINHYEEFKEDIENWFINTYSAFDTLDIIYAEHLDSTDCLDEFINIQTRISASDNNVIIEDDAKIEEINWHDIASDPTNYEVYNNGEVKIPDIIIPSFLANIALNIFRQQNNKDRDRNILFEKISIITNRIASIYCCHPLILQDPSRPFLLESVFSDENSLLQQWLQILQLIITACKFLHDSYQTNKDKDAIFFEKIRKGKLFSPMLCSDYLASNADLKQKQQYEDEHNAAKNVLENLTQQISKLTTLMQMLTKSKKQHCINKKHLLSLSSKFSKKIENKADEIITEDKQDINPNKRIRLH